MSSDDLVSRVHQQAQGEREAEVRQAVALFSAWRDAARRLLAETRCSLPAIVASSEELLEPLSIKHIREVGKRRKKKAVVETETNVGWELGDWDRYGGWNNDQHLYGRSYLLHDGRLLSAEKSEYSKSPPEPGNLIGDSEFVAKLAQNDRKLIDHAVSKIRLLNERAGRIVSGLTPVPDYYGQRFKHLASYEWDEIRR
jgi:hypothetical protein